MSLMTVKQCAEYLNIGVRTLRRYYKEKDFPYVIVGSQYRFRQDQVDRWIENNNKAKERN